MDSHHILDTRKMTRPQGPIAIRIVERKRRGKKTLYETKEIIGKPDWCRYHVPFGRRSSKGASIISSFPVTKQIAYVYKPKTPFT
jgi:hypothetical protein